jgi:hypothetical protein
MSDGPGDIDQFQSEEDQDLANCSEEELRAWWWIWFRAAQASNADDEHCYSHGVLAVEPGYEHLLERVQWGA